MLGLIQIEFIPPQAVGTCNIKLSPRRSLFIITTRR